MAHPPRIQEEVTLQGTLARDMAKDMDPMAVHWEEIGSNGSQADTPRPLTSISNHPIRKEDMDPSVIMEVELKGIMEVRTDGQPIRMGYSTNGAGPTSGRS